MALRNAASRVTLRMWVRWVEADISLKRERRMLVDLDMVSLSGQVAYTAVVHERECLSRSTDRSHSQEMAGISSGTSTTSLHGGRALTGSDRPVEYSYSSGHPVGQKP